MLTLEEARDIVNNVMSEITDCRIMVVEIPGENSFFNCIDSKSIIKAIIKKRKLPIKVINTIIPTNESNRKLSHALVFIRIRELKP